MVSSGRKIVPLLLFLSAIVSANAQPAADKAPRATISGKVTIGGKGVSGVVVGLAIATPSSSTQVTRFRGVTDDDGNYRIKNLPPDTYQVLVAAPAYVQSDGRKSVVVGKNEVVENVDITLNRGGVITGKVTDADGRPVVEEQIFFSATESRLPYWRTVRTDDRGVYRAFGLPPGRYTVSAGRDSVSSFGRSEDGPQRTYYPSVVNASDATAIEVNEGSETNNIDITLGRQVSRYTARGRIIDGDTSQPLPNARIGIQLFFSGGSTSRSAAAESTKDGEFKVENLSPGKYSVYLDSETDSELISETVRFEVTDQDIDGLLIKTSRGGSISGVVVLEGTRESTAKINLAGHRIVVFLSGQNSQRSMPAANIDQNGGFNLNGLPAGHLTLNLPINRDHLRLLRIERDGIVYRGDIEIKERERLTGLRVVVSQANGTIRGVLKLPEGVALPAAARLLVYVRRIEDPTASISPVEADASGQFLVQDLTPGTYEFNVAVVGVPNDQRPRIPRPVQTVVVTNGTIADVTITVQLPKTGPGGP